MRRLELTCAIILSAFAANAQDLSNSIEYSQLYIVGPATTTGWSDTQALEMRKIDNGVFEWEGELKGAEEFKFLNTKSWYKNVLSAAPDVTVELSKSYNLDFYAAWDLNGKDWKFKMPQTGDYRVIVDLRNMKMSVTEATSGVPSAEKLYVTGSAVDNQIIELNDMYDVEFKKTVSCKPGNVLLINTPQISDKTVYYGPMYDDVDLSFGKGMTSGMKAVDKDSRGWSVATKGDYTLYVDKNNMAYQGRKFTPRPVLYIVGGCCELNWNYWDESNKRFIPNPDSPEELIWQGELRVGQEEEPNKFKILTAESWTEETYHPYVADMLAEGLSDARISGGDDLKWTIAKDGIYRLTVNTKDETLKSEYLGASTEEATPSNGNNSASVSEVNAATHRVYVSDNRIYADVEQASEVMVCNLMGQTVSSLGNHISGPVTGQLSSGIYLVTINGETVKLHII